MLAELRLQTSRPVGQFLRFGFRRVNRTMPTLLIVDDERNVL